MKAGWFPYTPEVDVNEVSLASRMWAADAGSDSDTGMSESDRSDTADFRQWLQAKPLQQASDGEPSSLGEMLHSVSRSLHDREAEFDKTVKRFARTGDPVDGLAIQDRLSALYLQHGLAVKVIGKSAQALETLMRMT